jgi:hypothetical protein
MGSSPSIADLLCNPEKGEVTFLGVRAHLWVYKMV